MLSAPGAASAVYLARRRAFPMVPMPMVPSARRRRNRCVREACKRKSEGLGLLVVVVVVVMGVPVPVMGVVVGGFRFRRMVRGLGG